MLIWIKNAIRPDLPHLQSSINTVYWDNSDQTLYIRIKNALIYPPQLIIGQTNHLETRSVRNDAILQMFRPKDAVQIVEDLKS